MKEDTKIFLGLILIVGVIYGFSQGILTFPQLSINLPTTEQNIEINIPQNQQTNQQSSSGDLRLVAGVWVAATDSEAICNESGGVWHFEQNWVGCEGVGAYNCSTNAHLLAAQQCIGAGGNWVCNLENIYCKK